MAKALRTEALNGVFYLQIRQPYKHFAPLVPMAVSTKTTIPGTRDLAQFGFAGGGALAANCPDLRKIVRPGGWACS